MIQHPEWTKQQIANDLGVSHSTIYLVTSCDLFLAHYAKRREEINRGHDIAIGERLAKAATLTLDKMIEHLEAKPGNSIPLPQLAELSDKVLSRLGYGEPTSRGHAAAVQVNVNNSSAPTPRIIVSAEDLREARMALRATEQMKLIEGQEIPLVESLDSGLTQEEVVAKQPLPGPPSTESSCEPATAEGAANAESASVPLEAL
jgi:hypothetical protein